MNYREKLGLPHDAAPDEVRSYWKKLRSKAHPDHGGSSALFDRAHKLVAQALREAEKDSEKECLTCGGCGNITQHFGTSSLLVRCPDCKKY